MIRLTPLTPADYTATPWKNGGGTTIDIAGHGQPWYFGRTAITVPGPFSDYTGFDRIQVVVAGQGLVLETPDGDIDLRRPFHPVRFLGETPITTRLESGPVQVVNLIADRAQAAIGLRVLTPGESVSVGGGSHLLYSPTEPATVQAEGQTHDLPIDHALRVDATGATRIICLTGRVLLACIT